LNNGFVSSRNYAFDKLEVYDDIDEAVSDGEYTFGDLAEEYGAFEAVNLTKHGTIADHGERELIVRESRIPDAEIQASYINDGLRDAGKGAAKAAASMALPSATGVMAIESGGNPLWVAATVFSSAAISNTVRRSFHQVIDGISRRDKKSEFEKERRTEKIAEEDYILDIVSDADYNHRLEKYSSRDNVDIRDHEHNRAVQDEFLEEEEMEGKEFEGEILEPEDDDKFE
jgi:hypothetical protein